MQYWIGFVLATATVGLGGMTDFARERLFYPMVLIVIATYYILFAAIGAPSSTVIVELVIAAGFMVVAGIGFRHKLWLVAMALVGHGAFDIVHSMLIENPGVPFWWPGFCFAYDVTVGLYLAILLVIRRKVEATS